MFHSDLGRVLPDIQKKNELLANGIQPFITLFHWDVPQALEDEYEGFLDRRIVDDFKDYSDICFNEFGDRVKNWITLNEPWTFSTLGYGWGMHAPGRCSKEFGCELGDSLREPYIVAHNLILAHAAVFRLYEEKYKSDQKGEVGITLSIQWYKAHSNTYPDAQAADRAIDFMFGWYMEPLLHGEYPFNMRAIVRERLPYFTDDEKKMIKGSYDFLGVNYYTTRYAQSKPISPSTMATNCYYEPYIEEFTEKDSTPIGELHGGWVYVYPAGVKEALLDFSKRYDNPKIYITENGTCEIDDPENPLGLQESLNDMYRVGYYARHLSNVLEAMRGGVNVKGYFAWSLADNFEWSDGYSTKFGLVYVDYKDNVRRYPKESSKWFSNFLSA